MCLHMFDTDINECERATDDCERNMKCVNNNGSFTCHCKEGYTGKGNQCSGDFKYLAMPKYFLVEF